MPSARSGAMSSAPSCCGRKVTACAKRATARSRSVVPAVAGSAKTCSTVSLRLASCVKRWACTDVQYTQPLVTDTTIAPSSRSARGAPPGAYMMVL
jgi:hypothetical protein